MMSADASAYYAQHPLRFARRHWPQVEFYRKQRMAVESVRDNDETVVHAGHELGKDFLSGFVCVWFFSVFWPVRIVTTSVKDDHLRVLWGEIGRFINSSILPLSYKKGGFIIPIHRELKRYIPHTKESRATEVCKISYCRGMVAKELESFAGHHAKYTLFVADEASALDDEVFKRTSSWAKRTLIIGNPYPTQNYFYKAVKEGDIVKGYETPDYGQAQTI
jgi:hypothetical protein